MDKVCSVFGCSSKHKKRHSFPDPKQCYEYYYAWLKACDNPALERMTDTFISSYLWICGKHFIRKDYESNKKLGKYVVPTANVPRKKRRFVATTNSLLSDHTYARSQFKEVLANPDTVKKRRTVNDSKIKSEPTQSDSIYIPKTSRCNQFKKRVVELEQVIQNLQGENDLLQMKNEELRQKPLTFRLKSHTSVTISAAM